MCKKTIPPVVLTTIQKLLEEPKEVYDCQECGADHSVYFFDKHEFISKTGAVVVGEAYVCDNCGYEMFEDEAYQAVLQAAEIRPYTHVEVKNGKVERHNIH